MSATGTQARRPVVTGLGFVTPVGNDRAAVSRSLREGRHGLSRAQFLGNPDVPIRVVGAVPDFAVESTSWRDWRWPAGYDIPRETLRALAPHGVFAFCALSQALADAGLDPGAIAGDVRTGLFSASAGSALLLNHYVGEVHAARGMRANPMSVVSSISGTLNFSLAAHFRIAGAVCGFVSACASSSHALGYACDEIRLGRLDRVIVLGAEEHNAETLLGFSGMRALSTAEDPRLASRPFDAGRDGFVGAGGATVLVVESAGTAIARGARILAEVAGWGQSADGHSIAVSHPEGAGLQRAIRQALDDAGVAPAEVDWVCAHATSTPVGDRAEAIALHRVFTQAGARPVVSSTKGLTGHPLSLSGAMEAGFCALALTEGFIPGNPHLVEPDAACEGLTLPRESLERGPEIVLNNSSGFGGSNVCHVLRRWRE